MKKREGKEEGKGRRREGARRENGNVDWILTKNSVSASFLPGITFVPHLSSICTMILLITGH